jgi:hypothetical protein
LERAKIFHEEIAEEGSLFSATIIELKNALMVLLSEGEESLGTLAVSVPQRLEIPRQPLSSTLLGERYTTIARIIAERLAALTNKMVLVSVFLRTASEAKAAQIFIKLLEEALKKRSGPRE